jgi:hypothetical protein
LLMTIPGVSRRTAEVIVAEIGSDMGRFPTAAHLASWAGGMSRQQRVGRQAWLGPDPQGIQVAAGRAGRGGACGRADQEQLPGRPVRPAAGSPGSQEGGAGCCPLDPGHRLASAQPRRARHRPGRRLLRQAPGPSGLPGPAGTATRAHGPQGHPGANSRLTGSQMLAGRLLRAFSPESKYPLWDAAQA